MRVTFAARLVALVAVHQQMRLEALRGGFDDHQVAAAAAVVPVTGGVEHGCRMAAAEVVDQI